MTKRRDPLTEGYCMKWSGPIQNSGATHTCYLQADHSDGSFGPSVHECSCGAAFSDESARDWVTAS